VADALGRLERHREVQVAATSFLPAVGGDLPAQGFTVEGRAAGHSNGALGAVASVSAGLLPDDGHCAEGGARIRGRRPCGSLPVASSSTAASVEKWFCGTLAVGGAPRGVRPVPDHRRRSSVRRAELPAQRQPGATIYLTRHTPVPVGGVRAARGRRPGSHRRDGEGGVAAIDRDSGHPRRELLRAVDRPPRGPSGGFNLTTAQSWPARGSRLRPRRDGFNAVIAYSVARRPGRSASAWHSAPAPVASAGSRGPGVAPALAGGRGPGAAARELPSEAALIQAARRERFGPGDSRERRRPRAGDGRSSPATSARAPPRVDPAITTRTV